MKLLTHGEMTFKSGQISLMGQNINILPTNYFVGLTHHFLKEAKTDKHALDNLYLVGWFSSYDYMSRFEKAYGVKSFVDRYRLGMDVVDMSGFGDYKTIKWADGSLSYFYILNNPLPKFFYPSKKPVDHVLRGINAGGGIVVHHNLVQCVEEKCAAVTGGNRCVFITATEDKFDELKKTKLLHEQIDLDYLVPKQKILIKNLNNYRKGKFNPWKTLFS